MNTEQPTNEALDQQKKFDHHQAKMRALELAIKLPANTATDLVNNAQKILDFIEKP